MAPEQLDTISLPTRLPDSYAGRVSVGYLISSDLEGNATVRFLSGASVTLTPAGNTDFEQKFDTQQHANTMWIYSLFALRVLGEAIRQGKNHLRPTWEAGWRSAFERFESPDGLARANSIPSADHAAATRLHACLEAAELSSSSEFLASIAHIASKTLEWLCDDKNYRANNHGLMASMALLNWYVAVERPRGGIRTKSIAVRRIISLARKSFDSNGMCDENTIGYHNFNLRCYDQVMELQKRESIDTKLDEVLKPILDRADTALGHSLLQDGSIPTIGDSARVKVSVRPSINSSGDYSESGYGVIKDDRIYLSMICGGRSEIHKHHDDSSISLWFDSHPILIDAGSYLYDRTDPYRLSIESSYGHCGVFVSEIDGLIRQDLKRRLPNYQAQLNVVCQADSPSGNMTGTYLVPGHFKARRVVSCLSEYWVVVKDRVEFSSESTSVTARQRWLLGPQLSPERLGHGHWVARSNHHVLSILEYGAFDEDLYRAEDFGRHRGWYSSASGVKQPTYGLDFVGRGSVQEMTTVLHVGERAVADWADVPEPVLHAVING